MESGFGGLPRLRRWELGGNGSGIHGVWGRPLADDPQRQRSRCSRRAIFEVHKAGDLRWHLLGAWAAGSLSSTSLAGVSAAAEIKFGVQWQAQDRGLQCYFVLSRVFCAKFLANDNEYRPQKKKKTTNTWEHKENYVFDGNNRSSANSL